MGMDAWKLQRYNVCAQRAKPAVTATKPRIQQGRITQARDNCTAAVRKSAHIWHARGWIPNKLHVHGDGCTHAPCAMRAAVSKPRGRNIGELKHMPHGQRAWQMREYSDLRRPAARPH
eukprot:scaffold99963_cov22-Tisochrysis_lutea.AAC.1